MRAAIYARYSTELHREASIEDQVRLCKFRIDTEQWVTAGTYTDEPTVAATARARAASTLLGHKSETTADQYYIRGITVAAAMDWGATLAEMRRAARAERGLRRRRKK